MCARACVCGGVAFVFEALHLWKYDLQISTKHTSSGDAIVCARATAAVFATTETENHSSNARTPAPQTTHEGNERVNGHIHPAHRTTRAHVQQSFASSVHTRMHAHLPPRHFLPNPTTILNPQCIATSNRACLLYTSDAADE